MNMLQEKIANYVQEAKQHSLVEQRLKAHITIMEKSKIEEIQKLTKYVLYNIYLVYLVTLYNTY